jgi:hypothetical protein
MILLQVDVVSAACSTRTAAGADPSHPSNRKNGACWGPRPRVLPPQQAKTGLAGDPVLFPPQEAKTGLLGDPGRKLEKTLAHNGRLGMTIFEVDASREARARLMNLLLRAASQSGQRQVTTFVSV